MKQNLTFWFFIGIAILVVSSIVLGNAISALFK